jgi:23S rRNA A2030 N6-methylase RlmJ
MISRKNIRKYVQLLADIREELASPSVFKGSPGILRRLTNVQNSLHAKILPPVIMQLLNKNYDPQKHSPLKGGHDALMNLGSFTS